MNILIHQRTDIFHFNKYIYIHLHTYYTVLHTKLEHPHNKIAYKTLVLYIYTYIHQQIYISF